MVKAMHAKGEPFIVENPEQRAGGVSLYMLDEWEEITRVPGVISR